VACFVRNTIAWLRTPRDDFNPHVLRVVVLDDEEFVGEALRVILRFDLPDSIVLPYTDAELALQELEREDPTFLLQIGTIQGGRMEWDYWKF
jgi:hypothetical protein